MPGENMFLFWGSGSLPCWKAMLALEEKGFGGYSNKLCSFAKKEHKTDEIKALNPRCQLPTFKDGNVVVNESHAIVEYLESEYPDHGIKLLPQERTKRAKVFQVMHEISNLHQALVENIIHYKMFTPKDKIDQDVLKERNEGLRKELGFWDNRLEKDGPYVAGPTFTMADCIFFPYVAFTKRLGLKMMKWPSIESYYNRILPRPSVKATWPPHWNNKEGDHTILGDI